MKAKAVRVKGTLSGPHYWALDITLDDGTNFRMRMSDSTYHRILLLHTHNVDDDTDPDHDSSIMAALMGEIAGRITNGRRDD